ncbi:MAG: hypothetical protein ACXVA9_09570 [Bdellovibrionales bacterium]
MKWLLFIFMLSPVSQAATLQDALKEYGIKADGAPAMTVTKDQHLSGTTKNLHVVEANSAAHEHLELKIISPVESKAAAAMIESETAALKKLFAAASTPYMGDIAQAIGGCPAQYGPVERPVTFLKNDTKALLGSANAKLGFGACSEGEAKFKGAFITYYDESSRALWTWRFFSPWTGAAALKSDWLGPVLKRFNK